MASRLTCFLLLNLLLLGELIIPGRAGAGARQGFGDSRLSLLTWHLQMSLGSRVRDSSECRQRKWTPKLARRWS